MQAAYRALKPPSTSIPTLSAELQPIPEAWVEEIFTRLSAQFGAKMADLWAGVEPRTVKAEWAGALACFKRDEIGRGLRACQTRPFAPTLGEFLHLCRPALDPEFAWLEAQACTQQRANGERGEWSHPAVFRAASGFERELRTGNFRQHRKAWTWRLEQEFLHGWQQDVDKPVHAITSRQTTRGPNAAERAMMASLRNDALGDSTSRVLVRAARS